MLIALKRCLKSGAQALCSRLATLTNLLTPSAPVPHELFRTTKATNWHPLLYLIWNRVHFKVLLRWSNRNLLWTDMTFRGLNACNVGVWLPVWTWKGIVVVPRLSPSQSWLKSTTADCRAGDSCFQSRKSLSFFTSHYTSVLILFCHSGSFLARGLSHWPLLIQPPPPPRRAGWVASWLPGLMHHPSECHCPKKGH